MDFTYHKCIRLSGGILDFRKFLKHKNRLSVNGVLSGSSVNSRITAITCSGSRSVTINKIII